jgi:hypothetical protein
LSKIEGKQIKDLRLGTSPEASPIDGSIYYDSTNDQIVVRDTGSDILFKKESNLVLNNLSGTLGVTKGGTGLSTIASGKLLYASATDTLAPLSLASSLSITSGTISVVPAQIDRNALGGSTLTTANGGTGQTSYTNGQLLIGNTTGNTLTKSTLTAGTGVSIANGNGSITISTQTGVGSGDKFTSSIKIPTLGNSGTPYIATSSSAFSAIVDFSFNPNVYKVGVATLTFKFRGILAFANTGQGAQIRIFNVTTGSAVTNSLITIPSNQTLTIPLIFTSTTLTTSDFNVLTENVFECQILRTGSGAINIYGFEIEVINTF